MFEKYLPLILFVVIFIVLSLAFGLISGRMSKTRTKKFDERQQLYRLKGCMYAYGILFIYTFAYGFFRITTEIEIFENDITGFMVGAVMSGFFVSIYTTAKDAYVSLTENRNTLLVVTGIASVIFIVICFSEPKFFGEVFKNGLISSRISFLLLYLWMIITFIMLLVKTLKDKKNLKVEE